jgi:hypothetical protein
VVRWHAQVRHHLVELRVPHAELAIRAADQ